MKRPAIILVILAVILSLSSCSPRITAAKTSTKIDSTDRSTYATTLQTNTKIDTSRRSKTEVTCTQLIFHQDTGRDARCGRDTIELQIDSAGIRVIGTAKTLTNLATITTITTKDVKEAKGESAASRDSSVKSVKDVSYKVSASKEMRSSTEIAYKTKYIVLIIVLIAAGIAVIYFWFKSKGWWKAIAAVFTKIFS